MKNFEISFSSFELLKLLVNADTEELKESIKFLGGRTKVLNYLLDYIKEDKTKIDLTFIDAFGAVVFESSDNSRYSEDWDEISNIVEIFETHVLIEWLYSYYPGKGSSKKEEFILNWLLENKYNGSKLTKEIVEELSDYLDPLPESINSFKKYEHFKDELLLFKDLDYIYNNYNYVDYDEKEIREILKKIVCDRKIEDFASLEIFTTLVEFFAPTKGPFTMDKYKAFVLEIFEADDESGISMFDIDSSDYIQNFFYDVDFNESSDRYKQLYQDRISNEAKHISNMLKQYPNYRHD